MDKFIEQLKNGGAEEWLLLFAIYCVVMCTYSLIYCIRINRWPSVFGDLIQSEVGRLSPSMRRTDQNYMAEVQYRFKVDGVEYSGHRLTPFLTVVSHNLRFILRLQMTYIETRADGKVRVYYNPRKPEKSYLITPGPIGYSFIASFTLIPLACYFFFTSG